MWKFVKTRANKSWLLKLETLEQIERYCDNPANPISKDYEHLRELRYMQNAGSYDVVAHTEFGNWQKLFQKEYGVGCEKFYNFLRDRQKETLTKIINEHGSVFVNCEGGICANVDESDALCEYRDELEFPFYTDENIRIKQFPDGVHYYAYVGNTQVKDGTVVKWNTSEEAYKQAKKYINV